MCFSKRMKQSREKQGMTLAELGRKIGKTEATVQRYESGNIKNLKNDTIESIARALNVNPAFLMGWIDNENKNEDVALSLYQDIIENLDDLKENNAPLVKDFIEEIIKEQNNKSTLIPETTRIQTRLSYNRQHNVLDFAKNQLELQNKVTSIDEYKESKLIPVTSYGATGAGVGEELYDDTLQEEMYFDKDVVPVNADFCVLVNGDSMEPMIKEGTYAFIKREETIKDGTIALVILDGIGLIKRIDIYPEYLKLISLNPKYEDITVASFNDLKVVGKVVL